MIGHKLIAAVVGQGELLTRREIAARVGRQNNAAFRAALEVAVARGLLQKHVVSIGYNTGWGYCLPGTLDHMVGSDAS